MIEAGHDTIRHSGFGHGSEAFLQRAKITIKVSNHPPFSAAQRAEGRTLPPTIHGPASGRLFGPFCVQLDRNIRRG